MAGHKWTDDELAQLRSGETPAGRTVRACGEMRRRLGLIPRKPTQASYSARELADRLGVGPITVGYWRTSGLLLGIRGEQRREWRYTRSAVRAFLRRHTDVLDPARVDMAWLVEVLAGSGKDRRAS